MARPSKPLRPVSNFRDLDVPPQLHCYVPLPERSAGASESSRDPSIS